MPSFSRPAWLAAALGLGSALACGWLDSDPVAELAAEVLDAPVTTLAAASLQVAPELPPLRPGELVKAPPTGDGLQVLGFAPEGVDREPSQAAVIFDRPMVPLGELEQKVPLTCNPQVPVRARWAGTSTAVLVPEGGSFPAATDFQCSVPAGTAALDGSALGQALVYSFSTPAPAFERSWPASGASDHDPAMPVVIRFNQKVDPARVQAALRVQTPDGAAVNATVVAASGKHEGPDTVEVSAPFQKASTYSFTLPAGFVGSEGPRPSSADQVLSISTTPLPQVVEYGPTGEGVSPSTELRFEFATEVSGVEAAKHISVSPTPPDGWRPAESWESRYWYYHPRLEPRTTYTVTLSPGLKDVHGQALTTGATWSFTTGDLEPDLDAPWGDSQVYPASNDPRVPIRFRNVSGITVELLRVDPLQLVTSPQAWAARGVPVDGGRRVSVAAAAMPNKLQRAMVDLTPELVEGRGLVRITTMAPEVVDWRKQPERHTALLQVTDLGTNLKLTPDGATIWVSSLSSGAPLADVSVNLFRQGQALWSGTTDKQGLAVAKGDFLADGEWEYSDELLVLVQRGADASVVSHRMRDGLAAWAFGQYESFDARDERVQLEAFSDRGVYKAGDVAHVALTARVLGLGKLTAPESPEVLWTFEDPNGASVGTGTCALSVGGACSVDVTTLKDGALGDYSLRFSHPASGASGYVAIPVRAYRAPAFRVDVTGPERATAGDTLSAKIDARYLFGTPMKGASVKWSVRRSPSSPSFEEWPGFSFQALPTGSLWEADAPMEDAVSSGTSRLTPDGTFTVSQALPAAELTAPHTYLVEGTVTDADRQQVSGRTSIVVDSAAAYPGVRLNESLAEAGSPVGVDLIGVSTDGAAMRGIPLRVSVYRRTWDSVRQRGVDGTWSWVTTAKDEEVASTSVSPGSAATRWSFTPASGGYYVVRADLTDKSGRSARSEAGVWVTGGDVAWAWNDGNQLELVADRVEYKPGDTARILVKGPKKGLRALVTTEREGIWTREVVTLATTGDTLRIPITEAMTPNVFVSVVAAEGAPPANTPGAGVPAVWYGLTNLKVAHEQERIDVQVSTDRESYQPRDSVEVRVRAARGGAPLPAAHVVLWAVDYGVLSLTGYETPDLLSRFYAQHPLSVITADSRVSVYDRALRLAKGADVGGGGGEASDGARTEFATTPLWNGALTTNKAGELVHSFTLPDNLTTFKVMAVVDDGAASFGSGDAELRVNRPVIARPALPRFFRQGDRVLAGVVVHNNTASAADIAVTASATGATLKGAPRTVRVDANGAKEVPFAILDFTAEEVVFAFSAEGAGHKDAVEARVPVEVVRPSERVATSGSTAGEARIDLAVPADALPKTGGLQVSASASALVGIGASVDYLLDYPHGCLEQTGSRLRAALLAARVREKVGLRTSAADLETFAATGISRMPTFRRPDGAYSYWPGGEADVLATVYGMELLTELKKARRKVSDEDVAATARVLREVLAGERMPYWWTPELKRAAGARAALALARAGQGDPGYNNGLWLARASLPLSGQAELLETLARTQPADPRVVVLTRDLESRLLIESTSASLVDRDGGGWQALWWGNDVATIAFTRALSASQPAHPVLERLAAGLVAARKGGRWSNTWATAEALTALVDYASGREGHTPVQVKAALGETTLFEQNLGLGGSAGNRVSMDALKNGPLTFTATGGRVYYESLLEYAQPTQPPRDEGFTIERKLEAIEGSAAGGSIAPGTLMRVTLRVVTPVDRHHVALVDAVPAGLEPVDTHFATEASSLGGQDTGSPRDTGEVSPQSWWWSAWVFNRRELRDDEVIWYADHMPAGVHTQSWIARATTPGSYAHPAATVSEMYAPSVYGRTEAGRLVVGTPVAAR